MLFILPKWGILLPPIITFIVVMIRKNAIYALICGILSAEIIYNRGFDYQLLFNTTYHFCSVVFLDKNINYDNVFLLCFLWVLGILIAILNNSGAMDMISNIICSKIRTKTQAKLLVFCSGVIFFIDDFFNSLAIGSVCKSIFDRKGISREKLAYFLDTTAAPICILVPFSSWGAFVVGILDNSVSNLNLNYANGMELFLKSSYLNFYSMLAIILLFIGALFDINFSKMSEYEQNIKNRKQTSKNNLNIASKVNSAVFSIVTLFFGAIFMIFFSGYMSMPINQDITIINILTNIKLGISLFLSGLLAIFIALYFDKSIIKNMCNNISEGYITMSPAIKVLFLAWVFAESMSTLNVGEYIATILNGVQYNYKYLPLIIFNIACIMSMLIGSSWVAYSILIPTICQLCVSVDSNLITISIGAILAGGVFGDNVSPISDTTILSSIGAGCEHENHFISQLPYCLLTAFLTNIVYFIVIMIII